jgi:group I intron endonuclease
MTCGIYKLNFTGTEKVYIGQSQNIQERYATHLRTLKNGTASKRLASAYNAYGLPGLEVLLECEKDELNSLESAAIDVYNSYLEGFNSTEFSEELPILSGEEHPGSRYSNTQVEQAFLLLVDKNLTHQKISEITGVSKYMINHIARGGCHLWLSDKYPEEHKALISAKPKAGDSLERGKVYPAVRSPDGVVYNIRNLREFSRTHNIPYSSLNGLVNRRTKQVRGWVLDSVSI